MRIFKIFSVVILCIILSAQSASASVWNVTSIDTVKISRDRARDTSYIDRVPNYVSVLSELGPSHIAVGTPYNDEFLPLLEKWSSEIHSNNLSVWYRGNWSEWEGWFGYELFTDENQHHEKTFAFITSNPHLFRDGDIFTPSPEPENGILDDPRTGNEAKNRYLAFLGKSVQNCRDAFDTIGKSVTCSFYSTNGDIAKDIITKDTAQMMGAVTSDHYIPDPNEYITYTNILYEQLSAPVVYGEIGAPIPDIHGEMTEKEQAEFMRKTFSNLYTLGGKVNGVNYWTAFEGSTRLFDDSGGKLGVTEVIKDYYRPATLTGSVETILSIPLENASVVINGRKHLTDSEGKFTALVPAGRATIEISHELMKSRKRTVKLSRDSERHLEVSLRPSLKKIIGQNTIAL